MDGFQRSPSSPGPLVALWVPSTRADGSVRMEMQWQLVQPASAFQSSPEMEPAHLSEPVPGAASTTNWRKPVKAASAAA